MWRVFLGGVFFFGKEFEVVSYSFYLKHSAVSPVTL